MGKDYYKLLGVAKDASDDDIKKAYKKMVLNYPLAYQSNLINTRFLGTEMASRQE
jgi:preprotein translocase subunit Sec63